MDEKSKLLTSSTASTLIRYLPSRQRSHISILCYGICMMVIFTTPLWLNAISIGYMPAKEAAIPGILFDPLPKTQQECSTCSSGDVTYNITGQFNLTEAPEKGVLVLFVSNDNFQYWYYAGAWRGILTGNSTPFEFSGLCLGNTYGSKTWIVGCFTRGVRGYSDGERVTGPPFDDRCSIVGSICQAPCGAYLTPLDYCVNNEIPWKELTTEVSGGYQEPSREYYDSPFLMVLTVMTLLSVITQVTSAAPGFHKEEDDFTADFDSMAMHLYEKEQPITVRILLCAATENNNIVTRAAVCALYSLYTFGDALYKCGIRNTKGDQRVHLILQINEDNIFDEKRKFKHLPFSFQQHLSGKVEVLKQLADIGLYHRNFQTYHDHDSDWDTYFKEAMVQHGLYQLWKNIRSGKSGHANMSVKDLLDTMSSDSQLSNYKQALEKQEKREKQSEEQKVSSVEKLSEDVILEQSEGENSHVYDDTSSTGQASQEKFEYAAKKLKYPRTKHGISAKKNLPPSASTVVQIGNISITVQFTAPNRAEDKGKTKGLNLALDHSKSMAADLGNDEFSFLAINDARHGFKPDFLVDTIPRFWKIHREMPYRDTSVRFVQVPQVFIAVHLQQDDFIDRQNGYYYFLMNALRHCARIVSSSGTNAVWAIHNHKDNNDEFSFGEQSVIEDTETSHNVFLHGEKSEYIKKVLAVGSVKSSDNFVSASMRWAAGAVHNFVLTFHYMWFYYLMICVWIGGMFGMIFFLQNSHLFILGACIITILFFMLGCYYSRSFQVRVLIFANTTYWFTGILSALWWMMIFPLCLSIGVAVMDVNTPAMIVYGLLSFIVQWVLTRLQIYWSNEMLQVKGRIPKEEKTTVTENHFMRAYQNWALLWSSHILAIFLAATKKWNAPKAFVVAVKFFVFIHLLSLMVGITYPLIQLFTGPAPTISMYGGMLVNLIYFFVLFHPGVVVLTGYNIEFSGRHLTFVFLIGLVMLWMVTTNVDILGFLRQLSTLLPDWEELQRGCLLVGQC
eukprot:TRINITY_DN4171_c0_g1_i1.p1 TRINITY_DN4171_c0_g1~~TRINITY_DN4171_c0_g1_i1.p1  ORF type:complete len:1021 (-),score=92.84 TRINITY_DN4171_c0_g1_i1:81-3122(-)